MLTTYTPYDTIRAVLGVSAKELKDAVLAQPLFEQQFLLELGDVDAGGGNVIAQYTIIAAITPTTNRSVNQQRLFDLVGMFAAYSVARQLLTGAPLAIPQNITDGKAALQRFDTENFDKVREGVLAACGTIMARLKATMQILVPAANITPAPDITYAVGAPIGVDPVTGV